VNRIFSVPQVENEVKRTPLLQMFAEIYEAVTNELKKQLMSLFQFYSCIIIIIIIIIILLLLLLLITAIGLSPGGSAYFTCQQI